jgi:hypothetical protein
MIVVSILKAISYSRKSFFFEFCCVIIEDMDICFFRFYSHRIAGRVYLKNFTGSPGIEERKWLQEAYQ